MLQACVGEPLATIVNDKSTTLVKECKRDQLQDMWSIALESITQGPRECDW